MSKRPLSPAIRHHTPGLIPALLLGLCLDQASADDATAERARYHFDYGRLAADLERVRGGIHDYLTPSRAQPRDPAELLGDYRQPAAALEAQEAP